MGAEAKESKRRMLLHSMASLARCSMSTSAGICLQAPPTSAPVTPSTGVLSASLSTLPLPFYAQHKKIELHKEISLLGQLRKAQSSPRLVGFSVRDTRRAAAVDLDLDVAQVEEFLDDERSDVLSTQVLKPLRRATTSVETSSDHINNESILHAVKLLRKLQQHACDSERGEAAVQRKELDHILHGFSLALETATSTWDERSVEKTIQKLFDTHSNVFDESMQNFFIQNFLHESESIKTFRTALRRTSMLRHCLIAMYQSDTSNREKCSIRDGKGIVAQRWSTAVTRVMQQKIQQRRRCSIDGYPEITNPSIVSVVQNEIAIIDSWNFDVFAIAAAVPAESLCIIGNALLDKYDISCHFQTTKLRVQSFLRQVQRRYHAHPYHNAEHAADVTQTLHHFLSVGALGSFFSERVKCTALLAAIVHDVGHTSYSNNFHITVNDDLALQYVYRSPLEHMHCALAFQLMKDPQCNILQGLTKIEQHEVRHLITDMVLATDNNVHSTYLCKLENLVSRATEEGWKVADPDDSRLLLQMTLHAADVSNPAKSLHTYLNWTERIMQEFYQQGDKERELLLPVSIGYDRKQPIRLEKMQAGFIIGIVRPLVFTLGQLPNARLDHCMVQLDANLTHWQDKMRRNQQPLSSRKPLVSPKEGLDAGFPFLVAVDIT
ncbi:hypothetical protein CCR75_004887 [Bremia lactucae]|uniref:PDEase domain-containing protein n=1 Tax=Bremia lactucae TaxID=4779 RepID=A0A976FG02_BRELC|nr:hypothetical protein CCR75_004887 [Bremia lactucae]